MTVVLRFRALQARGIVGSWAQLKRLQRVHGFPRGRMLSPNTRVWLQSEIDEWLAARPTENTTPPRGAVKRRVQREAAAAAESTKSVP